MVEAYLPNIVEVSVWHALLCRLLCFLVKHDVQIEPRLQELHALEAQRFHGACDRWLWPEQSHLQIIS